MDSIIKEAITKKKLLEYDYDGYHRIVEPHIFGKKDGKDAILVYQVGGESSSGGLPNWRRMILKGITNMKVSEQSFPGRRPTSGKHSSFDTIYRIVS